MGDLYALGLGPGDPDLMTVRARALLGQLPVLFAPVRHLGDRSYALEIVENLLDGSRQAVELLPFPEPGETWKKNADRIVAALGRGDAGFLTEGDPLLYSTFISLLKSLQEYHPDIRPLIVPGVASPLAAAAAFSWPLADDQQRLAVLPAMHSMQQLRGCLADFDTVVLLKVSPVLDDVLKIVDEAGLGARALFVRRVGRPEQCTFVGSDSIRRAPDAVKTDYMSLLIVHASAEGGV